MARAKLETPQWPADVDPAFAAFCESGLWSGLGKTAVLALPAAGIINPASVTKTRLASMPRVAALRADRLLSSWVGAGPTYDVVAQLVPAGFGARLAMSAIDVLGDTAATIIAGDPWQILQLTGVEVDDADRLARTLESSFDPSDPRRAKALVLHALALDARNGHTATLIDDLHLAVSHWALSDVPAAIAAARGDLSVAVRDSADGPMLSITRLAEAEEAIARRIRQLTKHARGWGNAKAIKAASAGLDADQVSAVKQALKSGVSLLTGGPGTGKSRTVAAIVALAAKFEHEIALAAPTGRAAKRLSELAEADGTTIHRLLGAQGRTGGFARGLGFPIEADMIVIDESSMLDVELAASLLDAVSDGSHLLIVGDPAQLASIGPGRVLADLVESGVVPVTELKTLYRQAAGGQIALLATAVRGGDLPIVDDPTREVVVVPSRGSADAAHRTVQLVTDSIPRVLGIQAEEIQVVTPVHRGPAGTFELNRALKWELNRGPGAVSGFDVGDRVVATANYLDAEPSGYANGEVGVVIGLTEKMVTVEFASGTSEISGKALLDLKHGWAITVHRAQGSEWQAVVVVIPPESGRLLSRSLVYTALTRAQRHLSIVHAAGPAVAYAVRDKASKPRRTTLAARLREALPPPP